MTLGLAELSYNYSRGNENESDGSRLPCHSHFYRVRISVLTINSYNQFL